MGRNLIGAMVRVSQLLVAPSQARGDFGVTPSVCLICSRHSLGSERATCPPRPPPTPLSPQAWLLPPRACPAPCPRADTARRAVPADGRVTAHCSLSGHMSNPAAGPRPGWLGGGVPWSVSGLLPSPPPRKGVVSAVRLRSVEQVDPASRAPQHTGLARTGHRPSNVDPISHPHPKALSC